MNREGKIVLKESCIKRFEPVVTAINELAADKSRELILAAIDGRCASGKSTLGFYLKEKFDANLFHMDDFFLQKHQRTGERLAEVGGNVDYERFQTEVLEPLLQKKTIDYRIFNCGTLELAEGKEILPKRINIIEGSYSCHSYFGNVYDLKIFTDIDEAAQLENIRLRNGEEKLEAFKQYWIPKEEAYFEAFGIRQQSDLIIGWCGTKSD